MVAAPMKLVSTVGVVVVVAALMVAALTMPVLTVGVVVVAALIVAALMKLVSTVGVVVVAALMVAALTILVLTVGVVVVVGGCRLDAAEYHRKKYQIMFHQNCNHVSHSHVDVSLGQPAWIRYGPVSEG